MNFIYIFLAHRIALPSLHKPMQTNATVCLVNLYANEKLEKRFLYRTEKLRYDSHILLLFLMEARGTKKSYQNSFLSDLLFMQENIQLNHKNNRRIYSVLQQILVSKNNYEIHYGWLKMTVATKTLFLFYYSDTIWCMINFPSNFSLVFWHLL